MPSKSIKYAIFGYIYPSLGLENKISWRMNLSVFHLDQPRPKIFNFCFFVYFFNFFVRFFWPVGWKCGSLPMPFHRRCPCPISLSRPTSLTCFHGTEGNQDKMEPGQNGTKTEGNQDKKGPGQNGTRTIRNQDNRVPGQ